MFQLPTVLIGSKSSRRNSIMQASSTMWHQMSPKRKRETPVETGADQKLIAYEENLLVKMKLCVLPVKSNFNSTGCNNYSLKHKCPTLLGCVGTW